MKDRRFSVIQPSGNRAQRRQAERNERRGKVYSERVIPLPSLLDEFTVFDMPQSILEQISHGSVDSIQGVPVFRDNAGMWTEITPALSGWIFTWQKLNSELNLDLNLNPLRTICARLENSMPVTHENIKNALACLDSCRKAFRASDRQKIVSIAKTAQLQILLNPSIN
ncbi:MAG TPA: hypothetical protein VIO56_06595 [Methylotenera sp.]